MGSAFQLPRLDAPAAPLRAKTLPISVEHIRSTVRRDGRAESRERIVQPAMAQVRALVVDIAEALDIDERAASRTVTGRDPFDVGDVICIAKSGNGGLRLARRLLALLSVECDRIEFSSHQ